MSLAPCSCRGVNKPVLASFVRNFGDDIPEDTIKKATSTLKNWQIFCDCENPSRVISAGHWVKNDWYLCTIRHLATDKDFRGRGYGKEIVKRLAVDAIKQGCLVLAADVTTSNIPSQKIFENIGFQKVNTFCWGKGEKPANILHYVKMPAKGDRC